MRTLKEITKSLIESYNNNERPNFIDIRDLELLTQIDIKDLDILRQQENK